MTFCFFMFKSHRKQTTILDLRRILQKEIGSLQCGTTLMSNILLRKSYTTCVAFQLCLCNLLEIDAVVYCKVLCVCQKSFIETAPKINLVYFRWLMEVSNHVKFAFHHLLEFAPEVKQVRALTYISFVS